MTTSAGSDGVHRFGRRAFLARLGLGAGALALGGSAADAFVRPVTAAAARSRFASTDAAHFGRLFPELQPFAVANQGATKALLALGAQGGPLDARDDLSAGRVRLITDPSLSVNNPDNPTHTAGTTFVGQFIDHDVTFDASSTLGTPTDPLTSPTARTPALDLDSVYGAGPFGSPMLYDTANDPAKLLISSGGVFDYREDVDPLQAVFEAGYLERADSDVWTPGGTLYAAYHACCSAKGVNPWTETGFGGVLGGNFRRQRRVTDQGKRTGYWGVQPGPAYYVGE